MFRVDSGYHGVSTMDLTSHSDFSVTSALLSQREDSYITGRDDIKFLLNKKVREGEVSKELASNYFRSANHRFTENKLRKFTQGSTYVKFSDMIAIHLFESSPNQNIHVVDEESITVEGQTGVNRAISENG